MVSGGILTAHLQRIYSAAVDLLWQEDKKASGQVMTEEDLPVPGAFLLYMEMLQNGQTMYWDGGWADQPYLLYEEFEQFRNAEYEVAEMKRINAELKNEWLKQQKRG